MRSDWPALDAAAPQMLKKLHESPAPMIWHKHGSFLDHLRDVWGMLVAWKQPEAVCRLGLFHSAYSNSFVSMNLYNIDKDRGDLAALIGGEAENLVYKFCVINRQALEDTFLAEGTVRREGYEVKHIRTGETVELTGLEAAACLTETLADIMDQSFGWQSELEQGRVKALWPGPYAPTMRMSRASRLALALRASGLVEEAKLPPIFNSCASELRDADEERARTLYWFVVSSDDTSRSSEDALLEASHLNPHVAEPHVVRAQLLLQLGRWEEAEQAAAHGLTLFETWATQWDKRMPLHAWVAWTRCLVFQAQLREWPDTWGGLESLGAVDMSMRSRGLNKDRLG